MPKLKPEESAAVLSAVRDYLMSHRGQWLTVADVVAALDMNLQRVTRAMTKMSEDGEISQRVIEFHDYKWRPRQKLEFRFEPCSSTGVELAALFGMVVHPPVNGRVVRGRSFVDVEDSPAGPKRGRPSRADILKRLELAAASSQGLSERHF